LGVKTRVNKGRTYIRAQADGRELPGSHATPRDAAVAVAQHKRKRQCLGDFDLKGRPGAQLDGAAITVRYEEEHDGHTVDVPYKGIVKRYVPHEGLYVVFDGDIGQEILVTNEDEWRWGANS
jgi:hypothetical protein